MNNTFYDLHNSFTLYKENAHNVPFVSCFGKTFVERDSEAYKISVDVGRLLIENGFGVLHGGYTGIMEAISRGADIAINNDDKINSYYNIGVPFKIIDSELERVASINLPSASGLNDRKRALVEFCDICVVLPVGGIGTTLEVLDIFHSNQLNEKFGGKIKPIICIGGNWKKIFNSLFENLDMHKQSHGESFTYFCDNAKECVDIVNNLNLK